MAESTLSTTKTNVSVVTSKPTADTLTTKRENFEYVQNTPSPVWDVTHNLGKFASVTCIESTGEEIVPKVRHVDRNRCILTWGAPTAGRASFN